MSAALPHVIMTGEHMDFWQDRRVFVTGATGLVGSWLVRDLVDAGATVSILVRDWDPQSELIRSGTIQSTSVVSGALEDLATLERAIAEHEPDAVFHLGAQTIVGTALRSPLATFEANVRGTWNLLEACRRHPGIVNRIVVASSDKAYGESEVLPYTEAMPPLGRHPYDVSKSCADLIAQTYYRTYGTPVVVTRCGNIYGGGDLNFSRIVPGTIRSLIRGERPIVRSNGLFTRDYVYVRDVVDAYLRVAQQADMPGVTGEAFNFGPAMPMTVMELVNRISGLLGRTDLLPVVLDQASSEIPDQYLDSSKALRVLGWTPRHGLDAGLRETIAWYRDFIRAR
jgi:CDP-glucose 4,6-dehydratase